MIVSATEISNWKKKREKEKGMKDVYTRTHAPFLPFKDLNSDNWTGRLADVVWWGRGEAKERMSFSNKRTGSSIGRETFLS